MKFTSILKSFFVILLIIGITWLSWLLLTQAPSTTKKEVIIKEEKMLLDPFVRGLQNSEESIIKFPVLSEDGKSLFYFKLTNNTIEDATFWELKNDSTERQITFNHIDEVENIIWSPNKKNALMLIRNNQALANDAPLFHTTKIPDLTYVMYLYNLDTNTAKLISSQIKFAAWSPDGSKIVYAWDDRILTIANPDGSDWKPLWDITKDPSYTKDDFFFALSWIKPDVLVVNLANMKTEGIIYQIDPSTGAKKVLISRADVPVPAPNGSRGIALRSDQSSKTLVLWGDQLIGKNISPIPISTKFPNLVVWHPNGRNVYVIERYLRTENSKILNINTDNGTYEILKWPQQPFEVSNVFITKEGNRLYLMGYNQIQILELSK